MPEKAILVASFDPNLADVRKRVLEGAGYRVISASDVLAVRAACQSENIALVVIGYSLPPSEKRRVWYEVRQHCGKSVTILELLNSSNPILSEEAVVVHSPQGLDDLIDKIRKIPEQ
jgi:DNA-binding response OmpR family regulator